MDINRKNESQKVFETWIAEVLKPRALDRLVRADLFRRMMAQVPFLPLVLERQATQKEFNLPVWEYLNIAASDERIRNGRQMLRKHRALFNRIEQAFGVEPEVISAIWGLETGYGVVMGDTPVIPALATLAFRGRRASYFEDELIAALRIVQLGKCSTERMQGSWAGALGHGQFMPSAILEFGIDLDGDGRIDVCLDDPSDALGSIANYLKKHGWRQGQPWATEVRLPDGFDYARAGLDQALPSRDWAALGVTTMESHKVPDYGTASVLLPAGAGGVALLVLSNFHVIMRYNKAMSYAIGIGHLADRLGGGKAFEAGWPDDDRELASGDVAEMQILLTRLGHDTLGIDGMIGPNTTTAARSFQKAGGLVADGYLGPELLDSLRQETG